jgi:hypothetical protein
MTQHPCHWLKLVTGAPGFLEEAQGVVGQKIKKPEHHEGSARFNQQRDGG